MSDIYRQVISDIRHSADVYKYTSDQRKFLWSVADRLEQARAQHGADLTQLAKSKISQMGGTICGVLVRNEAGTLAAVSDLGRVTWLDGADSGEAEPIGFSAALQRAESVFAQYCADYPKWMKRISGTPAVNDLPVRMAKAFAELYTKPPANQVPDDPDIQIIKERDYWEEKATELAGDVGKLLGVEVGEHSSDNCPVENAIDAVFNAQPDADAGAGQWIPCSERLPTEDDADWTEMVFAVIAEDGEIVVQRWDHVRRNPSYYSDWMPTGLRKPQPPQGEE